MINKASLLGRVGKVDSKPLKNGSSMTSVSLATTRKYNDAAGVKQEITTWHHVNFFSKMADVAAKYVHVGDLIYVEGEISHKKIESGEKTGQWSYSLTASDVKFITSSNKSASPAKAASPAPTHDPRYVEVSEYGGSDGVPF
jgi:single-strand DNA-binding protein